MPTDTRAADEIPCICGDERNQHSYEHDGEGGIDWLECVALGGCAEEDGEVCRGYRPVPLEDDGPKRYADCPECGRRCRVTSADNFSDHLTPLGPDQEPCSASGWLVEDEDRVHGRWPRD